jgi:hypothetical protein
LTDSIRKIKMIGQERNRKDLAETAEMQECAKQEGKIRTDGRNRADAGIHE